MAIRFHPALCIALASLLVAQANAAGETTLNVTWEPVGIGGGGGVFTPSISPHDPKLMFVSCDMGGWYRSTDGGETWRMCDGRQVRKVNFNAVFHPTDPNVIYVGTRGGLKRSSDRGLTWEHVAGEYNPAKPDSPCAIAIDPGNPVDHPRRLRHLPGQGRKFPRHLHRRREDVGRPSLVAFCRQVHPQDPLRPGEPRGPAAHPRRNVRGVLPLATTAAATWAAKNGGLAARRPSLRAKAHGTRRRERTRSSSRSRAR